MDATQENENTSLLLSIQREQVNLHLSSVFQLSKHSLKLKYSHSPFTELQGMLRVVYRGVLSSSCISGSVFGFILGVPVSIADPEPSAPPLRG